MRHALPLTALPLPVLLVLLLLARDALCADIQHALTLGLGEEFNSNVNEKADAKADWVSVVQAVGNVSSEAARLKTEVKLDGGFYFYALGRRTDEFKGTANATAVLEAVQGLFFVEGLGNFRQVFTNLARGETNPTDSTRNQVNQNTVIGRAYLTPRLSDRTSFKLGYQFSAYLYNKPELDKLAHMVFLEGVHELSPTLQAQLQADWLRQDARDGWYERLVIGAGFAWQYSEDGSVQLKAGPRLIRYDSGGYVLEPYWEAKLTQSLGRFQAVLETSSLITENPSSRYSSRKTGAGASLAWSTERLKLTAKAGYSYLDGRGTQESKQLSLGLAASYELTPKLSLKASASREFSLTRQASQTRWYLDGAITYELTDGFFVEGYSKWKLSDSSRGGDANYHVNIVGLRLKKTF